MALTVKTPVLLDNTMAHERPLHPVRLSVTLNLRPPHTATMTLPEGETICITDWVEVYTKDGSAGKFRLTASEPSYPGNQNVMLEHGICTLKNDTVKGEGVITGTLGEILQTLLGHQSKQYWVLGNADNSERVSVEYYNDLSYDLLLDALDLLPNYALSYDMSVFPWVVNVVRLGDAPQCEGRFNRNVNGIKVFVDKSELCTRVEVSGIDGYTDADTISQYGIVKKIITVPYGSTEQQISDFVHQYLERHKEPNVSIEAKALMLFSVTGENWDRLELGRVCQCCLPEYSVTMKNRIVSLIYDDVLADPLAVRVVLANRSQTLRDIVVEQRKDQRRGSIRTNAKQSQLKKELSDIEYWANVEFNRQQGLIDLYASRYEATVDTLEEYEIRISAQERAILLRATKTELSATNERLVTAETQIRLTTEEIALRATKTELSATNERLATAETQIRLTSEEIALRATKTELAATNERLATAETQIRLTSEEIALRATKVELSETNERLLEAEASIVINADAIETKVAKNGVISSINQTAEEIKIQAGKINLSGYVTASQLNASIAEIFAGEISLLRAAAITSGSIRASTFYLDNSQIYKTNITVENKTYKVLAYT